MKHVLMRRQFLKIVGGMVLSPRPLLAASTPASGIQQVVAALLVATEEGSSRSQVTLWPETVS